LSCIFQNCSPPRASIKLTAVATTPNTVKLTNDLALIAAYGTIFLMSLLGHTCNGSTVGR